MSAKEPTKKELSPKEIQVLRDKQKSLMEEELPYLRVEEEYEKLQASIERSRYEQLAYRIKWVELKVGQNEAQEKSDSKPAKS